jgi:glycosyltransferase involved in cell wall biosynthesis
MRPRIVFAGRDPWRLRDAAVLLAPVADVTVLTGEPVPLGPDVDVVPVPEPDADAGTWAGAAHAWSAAVFAALAERFRSRGPDLIEFGDRGAEGFVTLQARRTGERVLRDTRVAVRARGTAEMAAILDRALGEDTATLARGEMERYCLRHADAILDPGGDVRRTYEAFYGAGALAPRRELLPAWLATDAPAAPAPAGGDLRLLYLGRLARRKGVVDLARALDATPEEGWRLSLLGGDSDTAPLGRSMREHLGFSLDCDPRVEFLGEVPRDAVGAVIAAHDAVVVPAPWACWPGAVREAYRHGRPVLATPAGGLTAMVEPGVSGALARDASPRALAAAMRDWIEHPERPRAMAAAGGPRAALARVCDPQATRAAYLTLAGEPRRAGERAARRAAPSVSVVVPYFRMDELVADTLDSIAAQTVPVDEVVIVDDGSLRSQDAIVGRLAAERGLRLVTQANQGLGAARNLGVRTSTGAYVLPLDADNMLEPEFVERALHALEHDDGLAYVTAWLLDVLPDGRPAQPEPSGQQPLGNWTRLIECDNWAGDGTALIRRAVFDRGLAYDIELASYEDWFLYRQMARAGLHGDVIPRRLIRYRVRPDSMVRSIGHLHTARLVGEMTARLREQEMTWTASRC